MLIKVRLWFSQVVKAGHTRDSMYITAYTMLYFALKQSQHRVYCPVVLNATVN